MNADKMLENEGYVFSDTTITPDKKAVVSYINEQKWNRIVFILEDKLWLAISFLECVIALDAQVTKAVLKKCEEMGWVESEPRQESNLDHYYNEILEVHPSLFGLSNGRIKKCKDMYCFECDFNADKKTNCHSESIKWLASPYKKPTYKLTQFEYDLIKAFDRCKECCLLNEIECLKRLREKGYFNGIDPFTKVHEIIENCEVIENGK